MSRVGSPALRRAGGRIVMASVALGVALLAAEGAVRLVLPQAVWIQPENLYVADPPGRYRLRAGVDDTMTDRTEYAIRIVTDENGLRVPPDRSRPPGAARLLALGDSFTFGVGVEEEQTWIERLGEALAAEGSPVETYNGGVPGYGAPDEENLFERHLNRFRPDLVILGVYVANDLLDASPASLRIEVKDDALVVGGHRPTLLDWLHRHSHLFVLVKNSIPTSVQRPIRRALGAGDTPTVRQLTTEMGAYARKLPEGAEQGIAATDEAYGRLVDAVHASGAKLVAMIIPEHIQVDPAFWRARLDLLALDPADYDVSIPTGVLRALLAKHGIPVLDLTPAVAAEEALGKHLYYPIDTHFTPDGHALAARELERFLRAQGLLPVAAAPRALGVQAGSGGSDQEPGSTSTHATKSHS